MNPFKRVIAIIVLGLAIFTLAGCEAPSYTPIAQVSVHGKVTDQMGKIGTGNDWNDGVSGQQLVAVSTADPHFRVIGDTVQGETIIAGYGKALIGSTGVVLGAKAIRPSTTVNTNTTSSNGGNATAKGGNSASSSEANSSSQSTAHVKVDVNSHNGGNCQPVRNQSRPMNCN